MSTSDKENFSFMGTLAVLVVERKFIATDLFLESLANLYSMTEQNQIHVVVKTRDCWFKTFMNFHTQKKKSYGKNVVN